MRNSHENHQKMFSSVITVEFAYNNREANSKEEYIKLLK